MNGRKWRKKPSEELIKLMEESVDLKLYLIHERGPLSLTFQDEQGKKYEINIGNEISCSCGGGKIEHCAHTLFALNKIYKIPFNNPLILQLQYTDQELNTLMEKKNKKSENKKAKESKKVRRKKKKGKEINSNQMSLLDDPVCPICQEDMYSNEGIYFCKKSCGHNFHIGCLKVFIKHKKDTEMVVTCPMCRAKWEEDDYTKPLMEVKSNKCTKIHNGINCANCQRTNIKFERFHCLNCENYDLCIECFSAEIHKEKKHNFIFKKHNEDKWQGCDYNNMLDDEDENEDDDLNNNKINNNSNKNNLNYIPICISLTNFLTNCLPDYKNDGTFQIKMDEVGNGNLIENNHINNNNTNQEEGQNDINNLRLENNMQRPVVISPKCAICKSPSKLDYGRYNAKTLEFLMLKYLPSCQHIMHVKCCEKAFRIISYEKRNKYLVVSQYFNKCRHDNTPIFPGLLSINITYEKDKKPSTGGNSMRNKNKSQNKLRPITPIDENGLPGIYNIKNGSNNNLINRRVQGANSMAKKKLIQKLLKEAQMEKEQNMGFGLNIQKINFGGQNDIQKYEMEVINKGSFNEKMKRRGMVGKIPYTQIHKVKKTEHIVLNDINKKTIKEDRKSLKDTQIEKKNNILANAGASLIVQKYNARPVRYEGPGKVSLSPLLINLPMNDN